MKQDIKWLSSVNEIKDAQDEELVRSLITADGRGKEFKKKRLQN